MAERLDIVSQSNFPTNKSNTVEIVTTTKKKVTTASASDIAELVTPAISNLDIATQTNFPIQESDAQSDFIITTDGGVSNVTAEAAAGLISSYIPTGGGDPHKPDFTADYSENYSDFSNFTGSGTEADPYQIWDEEMFLNMRFKVNNNGLNSETYFKQMRDIVWQFDGYGVGTSLTFITDEVRYDYGNDVMPFRFNYDGGNNKIIITSNSITIDDAFIETLVGAPAGSLASSSSSNRTLTIYVMRGKRISNLNLDFRTQILSKNTLTKQTTFLCVSASTFVKNVDVTGFYAKDTSIYLNVAIIRSEGTVATGIIENCNISNLYLNTNQAMGDIKLLYTGIIENCTINDADITGYISDRAYILSYNNINNLFINRLKLNSYTAALIYHYGDTNTKISNIHISNIDIITNTPHLIETNQSCDNLVLDGLFTFTPISSYTGGILFTGSTLTLSEIMCAIHIKKGGTTWTPPQTRLGFIYDNTSTTASNTNIYGNNSYYVYE